MEITKSTTLSCQKNNHSIFYFCKGDIRSRYLMLSIIFTEVGRSTMPVLCTCTFSIPLKLTSKLSVIQNIAPIYAFEQVNNSESVNASLYHHSFISFLNFLHALCNLNNMTYIKVINIDINFIPNQDKNNLSACFFC